MIKADDKDEMPHLTTSNNGRSEELEKVICTLIYISVNVSFALCISTLSRQSLIKIPDTNYFQLFLYTLFK